MKATSEMLNPYERVVQALEQGGTIPAIARSAQVSPTFAQNVVEHFQRIGRAGEASSLCSSGLGLCSPHPKAETAPEAAIACAGCPLAR